MDPYEQYRKIDPILSYFSRLREDILQAILIKEGIADVVDGNPITASICEGHAKAASEVAIKWILNAYKDGLLHSSKI